ncbi:MAG: NAD(P)-binding protein [Caulobacteraceae bacterium]
MALIRLNIDGKEVTGHRGQTVLEVARENGIEIPTMCYDERVQIYGSCGLCVVEVEGVPKLLRSCATEINDGMVVKTNTEKVRGSRKIALELLLSDHVGDCRPPCVLACPGSTDCQGYVGLIANGEYEEALKLIKEQLPLPASIGRVCPHPCEDACRRQLVEDPVAIAWLKSFVADIDLQKEDAFMPEIKSSTGKKVAVAGGGPGGLTAAYYLLREGHDVTIYDAMPKMGGMLRYGIPQYRLPKEVLDKEIRTIEKMGAKLVNNIKIGKDISLSYLRNNFDAVYVSIGAWVSSKINCPGEELEGVIGGIDFLRQVAMNQTASIGNRVAVVGGGNTAMDACRTAVRLGAKEVYVLYRRTEEEMPAEEIEIAEAKEEGVVFKFLVSPLEIIGENGKAVKIRLQKMKQGEPDKSGRRSSVPIEGAEEILEIDTIIAAIGQGTDAKGFEELELTKKGTIAADELSFMTSIPGVFAGGDATNKGAGIAIQAIGDAKKAAGVIDSYLAGEAIPYKKPFYVERKDLTEKDFEDRTKYSRAKMPHLSAEARKSNFEEINKGFSREMALNEAKRCLECGCHDVFECKLVNLANQYEVRPERLSGEVHKRQFTDNHPYIIRNSDKCILCGLCVRVCEEVVGVSALGLTERGFDTIIKPALDRPLKETGCISCGQCVSVCPTGALQERSGMEKPVPLKPESTHTVCSHCSVGCSINLNTKGNSLVRSVPVAGSKVDNGLLCVKGRFGFNALKNNRITKPMVRKEGKLVEVSWEEAVRTAVKKLQSISSLHGNDALAVTISDRYTNEEIYLASILANRGIKTNRLFSMNGVKSGIKEVLGYDASTNTLEELLSTETIMLVGSDVVKDHTIAGLKIRKAVKNGAKLIVINPYGSLIDEVAYRTYKPANSTDFLKEIAKVLISMGLAPKADKASGFEEFKRSLENVKVGEAAKEIAEVYGKSKKAMIVFSQDSVTPDAAKLLANIAVVSDHIGKPRSGILQLKSNSNSQGLTDMGVETDCAELVKDIENKAVKGLVVFGEDIRNIDLKKLEFLMVHDISMTETAKLADVVLPAISPVESKGTFTSSERRIQELKRAIAPIADLENWEVIMKLCRAFGLSLEYGGPDEIFMELCTGKPEYKNACTSLNGELFWPVNSSPVLYEDGFNFEDRKARLQVTGESELFMKKQGTDYIAASLAERLEKEGIQKSH